MYISASALDKMEAGAVLLEPLDTFMEDHGLLVARSLSQVSCNHLVVQVLNPGPAPVVVNKDVRVGVIKPVRSLRMSLQNRTMALDKLPYRSIQLTLEITNRFVNTQEGSHFTSTKK